jgi:prophage tail gpP-like protein
MATQPERYNRDAARITVRVNGTDYDGWLQSEVTRSLEAIAGTFSIPISLVPGQPPEIARQDVVQVLIGETPVVSGYVLAAEPFYRRGDCGMRITGRDRTGDLVHCSAIHQGGQWRRATLERIARDLVAPFGLAVKVETDIGDPIQDFKLHHGEPVLDALARAARLRGVMLAPGPQGELVLTRAGAQRFDGEIRRGSNVIEMSGVGSDERRHSRYIVYGQANTAGLGFENARRLKAEATDPGVTRYLPLVVNAEGNVTTAELQRLADHTMRVRRGHSLGFRYLIEGWTFKGRPWPLNQRVPIHDDIAGLDGEEWLIASVRHSCDLREGDVTELIMRPPEAYDTQPLSTKVSRKPWKGRRGPRDRALGGER